MTEGIQVSRLQGMNEQNLGKIARHKRITRNHNLAQHGSDNGPATNAPVKTKTIENHQDYYM